MQLADARRLAVRQRVEIHFKTSTGLDCLIDAQGIARLPGLSGPTDLHISTEFDKSDTFVIRLPGGDRRLSRQELAALCGEKSAAAGAEHDE